MGNGDEDVPAPGHLRAVGSGHWPRIVAGDFTGDGHLDLAVANGGSDTVSVLLGNGDGTFQPQVTYAVGGRAADSIVAGDFRGDGRLDLAVADGEARVGAAGQWRRERSSPTGHVRGRVRSLSAW